MDRNYKKILITGSSSYVGYYLIKKLLQHPDFDIVATFRENKGDHEKNDRIIFEYADLMKPESYDPLFQKHQPDYVIHLAALTRVKDGENLPVNAVISNYEASKHIIDLSISSGVKTIITTSSNLAQDSVSVVGITKYLTEQYVCDLETKKTTVVSLRMPNVIDSNGSVTNIFRDQIKNNQTVTITHPDMCRMFVSGSRSAELLFFILLNPVNKAVYVSTDEPVKILDLAKSMIVESGKDLQIEYIGIKPGEKIVEKSFTEDQTIRTKLPGLGIIKNSIGNKKQVLEVIDILNEREELLLSDKIQSIFAVVKSKFECTKET